MILQLELVFLKKDFFSRKLFFFLLMFLQIILYEKYLGYKFNSILNDLKNNFEITFE
jgi:hypothetical protein